MKRALLVGLLLSVVHLLPAAPLDSREYKLTLNNAKVGDESGLGGCWDAILAIAKDAHIEVRKEPPPWKPKQRQIVFYDTADDAVRGAGFLIRMRTDMKKGRVQINESDLALKFRSPDRTTAEAARIRPRDGEEAKIKFKEKWVLAPEAGTSALYQRSAKFKYFTGTPGSNLGEWSALFPGLAAIRSDASTPVDIVKGRRVVEDASVVGTFVFPGGVEAVADFAVWRQDNDVLAAEFSYVVEGDLPPDAPAIAAAKALYDRLAEGLGLYLNRAGTKTSEIYAE